MSFNFRGTHRDLNMKYIHQNKNWTKFKWDVHLIAPRLGEARNRQGRLMGRMESLGFPLRDEARLKTLTMDIVKTSEIEGDLLDARKVRSSIARRLALKVGGLVPSDRHVDGIVDMILDATTNFNKPLSKNRLLAWHSCLFPSGYSGMKKIKTGKWRDDKTGPMTVVSGSMGKERVHFEAPAAERLPSEINFFLKWFNENQDIDPVIKSGIAHLWFVTLHPFDDGNGRIARAIADMLLARSDNSRDRFYSMSVQIRKDRDSYYKILEKTQKTAGNRLSGTDITAWLEWFLLCLIRALKTTEITLSDVFKKAKFWETHPEKAFNERQRLMINRLFDGFEGKLTSSKWAKLAKCSQDTALRDILDLIKKGVLVKDPGGGRSTSYSFKNPSSPRELGYSEE